jgi:hypothetical protein
MAFIMVCAGGCKQGRGSRLDGVLDRLTNLTAADLSPGEPPVTYNSQNVGTSSFAVAGPREKEHTQDGDANDAQGGRRSRRVITRSTVMTIMTTATLSTAPPGLSIERVLAGGGQTQPYQLTVSGAVFQVPASVSTVQAQPCPGIPPTLEAADVNL